MRRVYTSLGLFFSALFLFLSSTQLVHARPLDPTYIHTCTELQNIATDATTTIYFLGNNIDCSDIPSFTPISNFQTTLNGNGFTISNLTIGGFVNGHGLFSNTNGATIENLKITNAVVQTNFIGGILVASAASTTISNVSVQGLISSGAALSLTGGLVGYLSNSTVTNCFANVASNMGYSVFGGLIGTIPSTSTVSSSYAIGNISIFSDAGNSELGGLVGDNIAGTIVNSYAKVNLSATGNIVGGLVGKNEGTGQIITSYSAGSVSGGSNLGGLVGYTTSTATTTNSYWDTQTSGQATSAGGTGKITSQMQNQSTFSGWDFDTVWNIVGSNYPTLQGIDVTPPTAPGIPTTTSPTNNNMPTVTWSAATDAGGLASAAYTVQWSTSSNFSATVFTYNAPPTGPSALPQNTSFTPTTSLADGSWYFRVQARDLAGNTSVFATSSAIIIDATAPVITLVGNSEVSQNIGTPYSDAGATATDAIDGDITARITTTGSVNTAVSGVYTITYNVTDSVGNAATPVVRTVTVVRVVGVGGTASSPSSVSNSTSNNIQNSLIVLINGTKNTSYVTASPQLTLTFNADPALVKGYKTSLRSDFSDATLQPYSPTAYFTLPSASGTYTLYTKFYYTNGLTSDTLSNLITYSAPPTPPIISPSTIPTATTLPTSHYTFTRNLRPGMKGTDVLELQKFLNSQGFTLSNNGPGSTGQETTYFGPATTKALKRFQEANVDYLLNPLKLTKGTGLLMNATRIFINQNF